MTRSLFVALFLVGCSSPTVPSPAGGQPTLGPSGPGDAASAGISQPGIAPAHPSVAGDLLLLGVTSDERAIFWDRSTAAVRMIPLDGGAVETLGFTTPNAVLIDGAVVFVWTGVYAGVGSLTARTPDGIRTVAAASYMGLAAASPDGASLIYTDGATEKTPLQVFLDSPFGRNALPVDVSIPAGVQLQFAANGRALVSTSQAPGTGATVTAFHPSGERVTLGDNVKGTPILDAPGRSVVLLNDDGSAQVTATTGGAPSPIDAAVSEAAFAGGDVIYRSPDGVVTRWSAAGTSQPLFTHVTKLIGVSADGAHALAQLGAGSLALISTDGAQRSHLPGSAAPGASFSSDGKWVLYSPTGDGGLSAAPSGGGTPALLSGHCTRVETAHGGMIVFDDAGSLQVANGATGLRERRSVATGVTGFHVSPIGDRVVWTTSQGLFVSTAF